MFVFRDKWFSTVFHRIQDGIYVVILSFHREVCK